MQINASNYIRDLVQLLYYIQPAYFLWGCLDYKTCGGKDSTRMSSVLWFKERERVCGEVVFAWVMCVRWLTKYNGVHCVCVCVYADFEWASSSTVLCEKHMKTQECVLNIQSFRFGEFLLMKWLRDDVMPWCVLTLSSQVKLSYSHSATCGYIQWNETWCLT